MKNYITKPVDRLMCAGAGIAGAVGFSQIPAYISQYTQNLKGNLAEARNNVGEWKEIARDTVGGGLDRLIEVYESNPVQAVVEAGKKCRNDVMQMEYLENAYNSLVGSDAVTKGLEFIKNVDLSIAWDTLQDYNMNVPLNDEGAIYGLAGFVAGVGAYMLGMRGIKKAFSRKSKVKHGPMPSPA